MPSQSVSAPFSVIPFYDPVASAAAEAERLGVADASDSEGFLKNNVEVDAQDLNDTDLVKVRLLAVICALCSKSSIYVCLLCLECVCVWS